MNISALLHSNSRIFFSLGSVIAGGVGIYSAIAYLSRIRRDKLIQKLSSMTEDSSVLGMLLGVAVGDAFGAGVKFQDYEFIEMHVLPTNNHFVNVRGNFDPSFGRNFRPGYYTDDTEMTVGLMNALSSVATADLDKIDEATMLRHWVTEYHAAQWHSLRAWMWKRLGVGRNGHGAFEDYVQGRKTLAQIQHENGPDQKQYPGNAPPMRALPLIFVQDDAAMVRLARANANSTHPHVKARAATLLLVLCGRYLLRHGPARPAVDEVGLARAIAETTAAYCCDSYVYLCEECGL